MAISDTQQTTTIALNEILIGSDLNGNGKLENYVTEIKRSSHYVADASANELHNILYTEGTAFLHTVRYVNVDIEDKISSAPRIKEVRYMV